MVIIRVASFSREANEWQRRRVDDSPPRGPQRLAQHVPHLSLVLDHLDVSRFSVLRKREEELQTDKTAGPLCRRRVWVFDRSICRLGHVGDLRMEGFCDFVRVAAEKHSGSHWYGKPLMCIASDRIRSIDSGKMMSE